MALTVLLTEAVVTASAVLAPLALNNVRTVVVLIRSVQAAPSVLVYKEM